MLLTFVDTFAPNYKGKLFKVEPADVEYELETGTDAMTPEGKAMEALLRDQWTKKMKEFKAAKEKEYAAAIDATEKNLYKTFGKKLEAAKGDVKKVEKELDEEVKGANVMIRNALLTLQQMVAKVAQEIYDKVAAAIDKKFKTELRKMKIKAACKIAVRVLIILAAAAVAILAAAAGVAVTGATLGVGAVSFAAVVPVVLGSLGAIYKAGKDIADAYDKEWPNYKKATSNLASSLNDLVDALKYEEKKREKTSEGRKLGPKEKIKLLMGNVKGKLGMVEKTLKICETYAGHYQQKIEALARDITKMQEPIDELMKKADEQPALKKEAEELSKKQFTMLGQISKARRYLADYEKTLPEVRKAIDDAGLLEPTKLQGVLGKVQGLAANEDLQFVGENGKAIFSGVGKIMKELAKIKT